MRAMNNAIPRYVPFERTYDLKFSVCSLVRDVERYNNLLKSFPKYGFTADNTEFLAADNRVENKFDGYNWQKRLYNECRGEYIIFCHEDIVLIDAGFDDLMKALNDLTELDARWLLAGVAGCNWKTDNKASRRQNLRISDSYAKDRRLGTLPARVESLDECFLVTRQSHPIFASYDLHGFHYYGVDQVLQAELAGGTAYAIDFHLRHDGEAKRGKPFRDLRRAFSEKYSRIYPGREIYCTTGPVQFAGGWYDIP